MSNKIKVWLRDILQAIREIESFIADISSLEQYQLDVKTRRAVERNVAIVGEAMNKIRKEEPEISITSIREIVHTRNLVIHAYDRVSNQIIWSIVKESLPILKSEVETILKDR